MSFAELLIIWNIQRQPKLGKYWYICLDLCDRIQKELLRLVETASCRTIYRMAQFVYIFFKVKSICDVAYVYVNKIDTYMTLTVGHLLCKHLISYKGKQAERRDEVGTMIGILILQNWKLRP